MYIKAPLSAPVIHVYMNAYSIHTCVAGPRAQDVDLEVQRAPGQAASSQNPTLPAQQWWW